MTSRDTTGAVLVLGGGVGGIQAALDLADSGFKVYLVERKGAIGGTMAGLDKTFPTNDCSMCILSPKLVECGRHLNVEIITNAELLSLAGEPGAFKATVLQNPRFVSVEKCTGCGDCAKVCPVKTPDAFNSGMGERKAIYRLYEQAYPPAFQIDPAICKRCGLCARKCTAGAIDLDEKPRTLELAVGAVVACPGFEPFDAGRLPAFGYGTFPNVITSIAFERILSASGPTRGRLVRPSDGREPRNIAWIQCVGSRDIHRVDNGYCSSVCCTYAIKEAVVAREHASGDLGTSIFLIDARTHGKGFERYYERARNEHGVRFVRSETGRILQNADGSLILRYPEDGRIREEVFDLVVLSVGMVQSDANRGMATRLGLALDEHGFCETGAFSPSATPVPGVFAAGAFTGPKDIPETVTGASAAAAEAAALLSGSRNTLATKKEYPEELPAKGARPRIGVWVCSCGINIGSVVDVAAVRDRARGLPNVVVAEDAMFTCSQDTQRRIRESIAANRLNRVVVAACTPRTHEPLFQETLREAGLNRHLFEMANIRDQCAWVHQGEPEKATAKAVDLVGMAVAKARLLEPLSRAELPVDRNALVVGGGVAGMSCAAMLSGMGFGVHLVESSGELGGNARAMRTTLDGSDVGAFLADLEGRVLADPRITVHMISQVSDVSGFVGSFTSTIRHEDGSSVEVAHGAAVIASGGGTRVAEGFGYGEDPRVMTLRELEEEIGRRGPLVSPARNVVLIQCAGSRDEQRRYCSRTCCSESVKLALELLDMDPSINVYVLYRDIRTYGAREGKYTEARERGVRFLRHDENSRPYVAIVDEGGEKRVRITAVDLVLGETVSIDADIVGLASAITPSEDAGRLAGLFKVPLDEDGFFMEAHVKLRPVDFATEGVFVCGLAHGPKTIGESIAQAGAAASRAALVLSRDSIEAGGTVCRINSEKCSGCGTCAALCPFRAIEMDEAEGKAAVNEALCKGCGLCASSCRCGAADILGFTDREIHAMIGCGTRRAP
ncbi:MAG: FAD-dependent oxidoreductase [Candidatus Fermentibacter sp.]|nr:FAD-dependent oxidoreductase [Candidatus Fermentibacter sp.]